MTVASLDELQVNIEGKFQVRSLFQNFAKQFVDSSRLRRILDKLKRLNDLFKALILLVPKVLLENTPSRSSASRVPSVR